MKDWTDEQRARLCPACLKEELPPPGKDGLIPDAPGAVCPTCATDWIGADRADVESLRTYALQNAPLLDMTGSSSALVGELLDWYHEEVSKGGVTALVDRRRCAEALVVDRAPTPGNAKSMTIRDAAGLLPPEQLEPALQAYGESLSLFRDWLLSHMVEGVHYGYPPGCGVKKDEHGQVVVWDKDKWKKDDGKWKKVHKSLGWIKPDKAAWIPKPTIYKAGALIVCSVLRIRPEYFADEPTWVMLGKPPGSFCYICKLVSKDTGDVLGEGRGSMMKDDKGMDPNGRVKMAQKRAMVDAVLTTVPELSALFTQDLENDLGDDPDKEPGPGPAQERKRQRDTKPTNQRKTRRSNKPPRDEEPPAAVPPGEQAEPPKPTPADKPLNVRQTDAVQLFARFGVVERDLVNCFGKVDTWTVELIEGDITRVFKAIRDADAKERGDVIMEQLQLEPPGSDEEPPPPEDEP